MANISRKLVRAASALVTSAVPELTCRVDIKLNNEMSLQRRLHRILITHRTTSPVRAHTRQRRQAIILRFGGLVAKAFSGCSSMAERWLLNQRCRFNSAARSNLAAISKAGQPEC
jgi:hypothetical protein